MADDTTEGMDDRLEELERKIEEVRQRAEDDDILIDPDEPRYYESGSEPEEDTGETPPADIES
jgi:hypothetical protein